MVTLPVVLSTDVEVIPQLMIAGEKVSSLPDTVCSSKPKEFLANPITFTAVLISELLNALLEKDFLLTTKGAVVLGKATTLVAKPAFKLTATSGAK